jgi:ppGpp synthetase/RelA/SpoT-type nucleotidyltranferase
MKYIPKHKIKSVKFTHNNKDFSVDSSKITTGIYQYDKGGKLKDYTYISKNKVKEFITTDGVIKNHSNGIWVLTSELNSTKPIKSTKTVAKKTPESNVLLPPSEIFKGQKNMPLNAFKLAEECVSLYKQKAEKKLVLNSIEGIHRLIIENKDFEEWFNPLSYTILWLNYNLPMILTFEILGKEEYYGEGIIQAFKENFKKAPDFKIKVNKIKTGNFLSNKEEQNLLKTFAGKDVFRLNLQRTYIDDGYAVSTNAHILLAIYDKTLLGKEEYFDSPTGLPNYPKWRGVVPNIYNISTKKINAQRLLDFLNKTIKYGATNPITKAVILKVNQNNFGFNIPYLIQSLKAIMQLGKDDFYIHFIDDSTNRAIILTHIDNWNLDKQNSTFALVMPVMVRDSINEYMKYDIDGDIIFKDGGKVGRTISIVNDGMKFDKSKYQAVYGDFDKDGTVNIDDANPLDSKKRGKVEQVELRETFDKLLKVKGELDTIMNKAVDTLDKKAPKNADIYARTKTPYSIIKKLVEKRMLDPQKGLTDMIGTTIAVDNQKELEQVRDDIDSGLLGKILDRDDYYKSPKAGYRAYHYIVEYEGIPVEVQLKTKKMKKLNEVSHEFYKNGTLNAKGLDSVSETFEKADRGNKEALKEVEMLLSNEKALASKISTTKMANGGAIDELRKQKDIDIYEDVFADGGKIIDRKSNKKKYKQKPRKTKTKKPNSFFAVVKREQKKGESWRDAIQRVKKLTEK